MALVVVAGVPDRAGTPKTRFRRGDFPCDWQATRRPVPAGRATTSVPNAEEWKMKNAAARPTGKVLEPSWLRRRVRRRGCTLRRADKRGTCASFRGHR